MIPIDSEHRLITLSLLQAVMIPIDSEHTYHIVTVTVMIPTDSERRLITLSLLQAVIFPLTVNTD